MNDDIQAKMDFIVNQQAQFAANVQIHEERLTRLESTVAGLAQLMRDIVEHFEARTTRLEAGHISLEAAQERTEEARKRTEEAFARLAESQAHTDRRLDALIDIIRQEREGRNGKA